MDKQLIRFEFPYISKRYEVSVPVSDIDTDHYEDVWEWWFQLPGKEEYFCISGDKNENNEPTTQNVWIDCYENVDADVEFGEIWDGINIEII